MAREICWTGWERQAARQLAHDLRRYGIDARAERTWSATVPADQFESACEHIRRLAEHGDTPIGFG